ncbi:MAG: hypothetical protein ACRCV6_08080 [Formosimonas sp.]
MSRKSKSIVYLGEGKTEDCFIKALGLLGRFRAFNVWEKDVGGLSRDFDKQAQVVLLIDADQCNPINVGRLMANVKKLQSQKFDVKILLQVMDLEDEIIKGFGSQSEAFAFFKVDSKSGLKRVLTRISNLDNIISVSTFDRNRLWCAAHPDCDDTFSQYRAEYKDLVKKST